MSAEREEEGWESEEKDWRVSKAAVWEGSSVRRLGSMVEGIGGSEDRGGRGSALSGGGRRRDSHVFRSICRLDRGTVLALLLSMFEGWEKAPARTELFVAPGLVSWLDSTRS